VNLLLHTVGRRTCYDPAQRARPELALSVGTDTLSALSRSGPSRSVAVGCCERGFIKTKYTSPLKLSGKTAPGLFKCFTTVFHSARGWDFQRGQVTFRGAAATSCTAAQCHKHHVRHCQDGRDPMNVAPVPYLAEEHEGCLHLAVELCSKVSPPLRAPKDHWPGDSASCSLGR